MMRLGCQAAKRKASWNRWTTNPSMGDMMDVAREEHLEETIKSTESSGPTLRYLAGSL
jgi:hypothetical protein